MGVLAVGPSFTVPFWLRCRLAWDQPLRKAVLGIFLRVVERSDVRRSGLKNARCGAVSVLQHFDSALR